MLNSAISAFPPSLLHTAYDLNDEQKGSPLIFPGRLLVEDGTFTQTSIEFNGEDAMTTTILPQPSGNSF